jgi:N-acetylmuramoyl-L-alanine amidase
LTLAPAAPALRTVVLDPGHGGEDAGARGANGVNEKDLTLAVARRLKATIEGRLGIRVLLTRDDDRNVPIDERTAIANNNKADLFISLHANVSLKKTVAGATIYVASFDRQTERAVQASQGIDRLPAFGGGSREVELLMWDLAQIRHIDQSAALAEILAQQFQGRVPLAGRPIDRAPLRVLESANMPAVLVEMGYLSNADQEKLLAGNEFQSAFAQAAFDALVKFRDTGLAAAPPAPATGGLH